MDDEWNYDFDNGTNSDEEHVGFDHGDVPNDGLDHGATFDGGLNDGLDHNIAFDDGVIPPKSEENLWNGNNLNLQSQIQSS